MRPTVTAVLACTAGALALACAGRQNPPATAAPSGDPSVQVLAIADEYLERLYARFPDDGTLVDWPRTDHGATADVSPAALARWRSYEDDVSARLRAVKESASVPVARWIGNTAYVEGWGLYSERLAEEMGLNTADVDRMGMLSFQALRAARLVVDSGMHALGWSREQAIEYLLANTTLAPEVASSEVNRYAAVPGQAFAYMLGALEIRRLRASAERALGPRFDVRAFHDVVLGGGPLPLRELGERIDAWVAAGGRAAPNPAAPSAR